MSKFMKIPDHGILEIDQIIFGPVYPILFTCFNAYHELFLCICPQNNEKGKKWVIVKTAPEILVDMLQDNITMYDAFFVSQINHKFLAIVEKMTKDKTKIRAYGAYDVINWPEIAIYLPDRGEYLGGRVEIFSDMIHYYQNKK